MAKAVAMDRQAMLDSGLALPDETRARTQRAGKPSASRLPEAPGVQKPQELSIQKIAPVPRSQEKLKVACYGRVSTLHEDQEGSLEAQEEHFRSLIEANDEWQCAGIYLDKGLSGTKAETRPALQKMLEDCRAGKIELVLTKSLSRFARNCAQCLQMVRDLNSAGVEIFFEKERIRTGTMVSDFMLSVMAVVAEEESRSISGNIKWAVKKRFKDGTYKPALDVYGYKRTDSRMAIVEEEASVVREIFSSILSGYGLEAIAKGLNERGIRTNRGALWSAARIGDMVHNPVYAGDRLYQKTFMDDQYRQLPNRGEKDQYYDEGCHKGIISPEDFEKTQELLARRNEWNGGDKERKKNLFSGKLICGKCGKPLRRRTDNGTASYRCATPGCTCNVKEAAIKNAFLTMMNKLAWSETTEYPVVGIYEEKMKEDHLEAVGSRIVELEDAMKENTRKAEIMDAASVSVDFRVQDRREAYRLQQEAEYLAKELAVASGSSDTAWLRETVSKWKICGEDSLFPAEIFMKAVKKVVIGERAAFHFKCGIVLEEMVRPEAAADV